MTGKKLFFLFAIILIALISAAIFQDIAQTAQIGLAVEQEKTQERVNVTIRAVAGNSTILEKTIQVEKGITGFEAMKLAADIEYVEYEGLGAMIAAINRVTPSANEFWALYINGEMASVGIGSVVLNEDTLIEWKIESMGSYTG